MDDGDARESDAREAPAERETGSSEQPPDAPAGDAEAAGSSSDAAPAGDAGGGGQSPNVATLADGPAADPASSSGAASSTAAPDSTSAPPSSAETAADGEPAPPMPTAQTLEAGTLEAGTLEAGTPPMPEVEQLSGEDGKSRRRRRPILVFDKDRPPAGSDGGSFFDPGKIADGGPGGGIVQLRGFVSGSFLVTERSNTRVRTDAGGFERVRPLPFFGAGTATLYVGAAIWADAVYARISLEYLAIPRVTAGTEDVLAPARRELLVESAALELNPFVWIDRAPQWFREGFKLTAGVFIVPFGIEDEAHAAPINWFTARPRVMTNGRVYPGTWSDVGVMLKFQPTFRPSKPIRPLELDIGLINGDPCTQTRFTDALYSPSGVAAPCERLRRPGEAGVEGLAVIGEDPRADLGFLGIGPDNNQNKSLVARATFRPLADLAFGGSLVWGKHPRLLSFDERITGRSTIDVPQARSWRAGAHLGLDLDRMIASPYPLPQLRGELIVGVDAAPVAREGEGQPFADRRLLGGYAQIAQPLYRRKRSQLPGVMLQYRVDWSDPDRDVPGVREGPEGDVALRSDFADAFFYDESQIAHSIGLRWIVIPRLIIKADYTLIREDGGSGNQLANDRFAIQLVGDF